MIWMALLIPPTRVRMSPGCPKLAVVRRLAKEIAMAMAPLTLWMRARMHPVRRCSRVVPMQTATM